MYYDDIYFYAINNGQFDTKICNRNKNLKMNDGMRSSGLVCISTNTFSDVDNFFIYKMFTFRSPDRGASSKQLLFCKKQYFILAIFIYFILAKNNILYSNNCTTFVSIPYVQAVSEPIKRVLAQVGIEVALKPYFTLSSVFRKPKDVICDEKKCGLVYKIPCRDCDAVYVGEIDFRMRKEFVLISFKKPEESKL